MTKDKNTARKDFTVFVQNSWTWERLTEAESGRALAALFGAKISGTYCQRKDQLNSVYHGFLLGLGYTGTCWRDPKWEDVPLF